MKPVPQTVFSGSKANCFAACIASILECDIANVPQYGVVGDYWPELGLWLSKKNLRLHYYDTSESHHSPSGWAIKVIRIDDSEETHAVVCFDGESMWDPSSSSKPSDCPVKRRAITLKGFYVLTVSDYSILV